MVDTSVVLTGRRPGSFARRALVSLLLLHVFCLFQPSAASARPRHYGFAPRPAHSWPMARGFAGLRPRHNAFVARAAYSSPGFRDGAGSNVIAEATRYLGAGNVTGTRGPWCADYASMVLRHSGHRPLAGRSVVSALAYGPRVSQPKPGDLVVLGARAGYLGHVGFFAGWENGRVVIVSGNWGHRVARASISPGAVVAFIGV